MGFIHLAFQVFYLLFQSRSNFFASLDRKLFSLIQLGLHIFNLVINCTSISFCILSIFLFSSKFISKTSSIDHCFFSLFFSNSAFIQHFFKISMHCLHFRVKLPLAGLKRLVLQSAVRDLLHYIRELLLCRSALAVSMFKLCFGFFQLITNCMSFTLRLYKLFPCLIALQLFLLQSKLSFPDVSLIFFDGLLSFSICTVCMLQSNVKLIQICFQLFLVTECLTLCFCFILK